MRFINVFVIIVVICGVFQLSHGEILQCDFKDVGFAELSGTLYSCDVISLENLVNNMNITGYLSDNSQQTTFSGDIKAIQILSKKTNFIPGNLGTLFNLVALRIENSKLFEIKSQDFYNMQNLKHLSLWNNKLTSLPSDVFSTLTQLKEIYLAHNQIEEIPFDLFFNNGELEIIDISNNKIKYLGSGIFDGLMKLNKVHLSDNFCVNKDYIRNTAIQQLKQEMKTNCNNLNELKFNQIDPSFEEQKKCQIKSEKLRKSLSEKTELLETIELKMQKEINELKIELFELKQQRILEQTTFTEVRSKLKENK